MSVILDKVSYTYSPGTSYETHALKNISLGIGDHEFIGIIGRTGSGKSTLIQLLNGLLPPTGGHIYYNGRDISDSDFDRKELRSKVGMVFQYPQHQLFEETVLKDVCFGPRNLGLDERSVQLRAYEALQLLKVPRELFDQPPFQLSGGQQKRVAIAGVAAMRPEVLVLDEPTAGMDPAGRDELFELITEMYQELNMTIVLVSHSMEDVARYVQRLLVIHDGEMMMDGAPEQVFRHYRELETIGLAAPQITYLMNDLADAGYRVNRSAATVEEAVNEILTALGGRFL